MVNLETRQVILMICCLILLIVGVVNMFFGGIVGIILGGLTVALAIVGGIGAWMMRKDLLFGFLIGAGILLLFAIISFILALVSFSVVPVITSGLVLAFYVITVLCGFVLWRHVGGDLYHPIK